MYAAVRVAVAVGLSTARWCVPHRRPRMEQRLPMSTPVTATSPSRDGDAPYGAARKVWVAALETQQEAEVRALDSEGMVVTFAAGAPVEARL